MSQDIHWKTRSPLRKKYNNLCLLYCLHFFQSIKQTTNAHKYISKKWPCSCGTPVVACISLWSWFAKKQEEKMSKLFTENEKAKEKNVFQTGMSPSSDSLIFYNTCGDYSFAIMDHCCRNAEHHLCKAAYFFLLHVSDFKLLRKVNTGHLRQVKKW